MTRGANGVRNRMRTIFLEIHSVGALHVDASLSVHGDLTAIEWADAHSDLHSGIRAHRDRRKLRPKTSNYSSQPHKERIRMSMRKF
jgi:hypothetical protein